MEVTNGAMKSPGLSGVSLQNFKGLPCYLKLIAISTTIISESQEEKIS